MKNTLLRDHRGVAFLYVLLMLMVFLLFISVAVDVGQILAVKIKAKHSLNLSLRAAADQLDMEKLADPINPVLYILEVEAKAKFDDILQKNLKLDAGFNPSAGSVAKDTVSVDFEVFNSPGNYSYVDSNGLGYSEFIDEVAVTGSIEVPIKLSGFAKVSADIPEDFLVLVHATVKPQLMKQDP